MSSRPSASNHARADGDEAFAPAAQPSRGRQWQMASKARNDSGPSTLRSSRTSASTSLSSRAAEDLHARYPSATNCFAAAIRSSSVLKRRPKT